MMFDIVASGSSGNCLIIDGCIAIDMGVSLKAIQKYIPTLKLVLLTHQHSDHYNKTTIKALQSQRPMLRFACMEYMNLRSKTVDILQVDTLYNYGICSVRAFELCHDVCNVGWKIQYNNKRIIYATDTNRIDHVEAKDYDFYFIEANHKEYEIKEVIKLKQEMGIYSHEMNSINNHLSKEKCDEWLLKNMGQNSQVEYMHISKGVDRFYECYSPTGKAD